jgi:hypothetical protein
MSKVEIEFTTEEGGHWLTANVSLTEYAAIMNTGNVCQLQISAVRLWSHTVQTDAQEDPADFYLVYDFTALDTDAPAWRLEGGQS